MNNTEAAEILAATIAATVRAQYRLLGEVVLTTDRYIEDTVAELAEHSDGRIREAARLNPGAHAIRAAGRRVDYRR